MSRKNPFFLFVAACIPGCGQMYQGYMKRGASLLTVFCAIIAVATWLYIGQLALFLPVLWLYAFFDTYNIRRAQETGGETPDAYLFGLSGMDQEQLARLFGQRHSVIGWALVIGGVYVLWQQGMDALFDFFCNMGWENSFWLNGLRNLLLYQLPHLVVILFVIGLGIWFIRGPKQKQDGDFTGFVPPEEEPPYSGAPSGAAPDGAPAYKTVTDVMEDIIHHGEGDSHAGQ